ncbi:restriction endonuclease subunit S [Donghicola sp.]|jgi:type I restriction enzyme S subunit|uniref:restriction endonuclease subunit S n=1 Tax=Donghicola sp. TaxID=1929294 RepID=UPI0025EF62AB|nr:restriction endonuclease subunit S [Donghicola sp.]MCT4579132.1 restriction endonuclease subunit S [Donghicola sp.]
MTELPKGWAVATVGELFHYYRGVTYSKEDAEKQPSEGRLPVLRANNFNQAFDLSDLVFLPEAMVSPDQRLRSGDLLFAMSSGSKSHVGKCIEVKKRMNASFGAFCGVLRPVDAMAPSLFVHAFQSKKFRNYIEELAAGTNINNLKRDTLLNYELSIPPLNEQRRIVERIEAMFDEIDHGVENLKKARATLGLYRQSLLKSAFEGRLTADWRARNADKLETPETLLARIRSERDSRYKSALDDWQKALTDWRENGEEGKKPSKPKRPRDIAAIPKDIGIPGWTTVPLGLIIDTPTYGTSKKCDYDGGAKGVLRIPNIGAGRVDATDLKSADFDEFEIKQYGLEEGDVLTVRSNGSLSIVGKPALVTAKDTAFLFAGYLIRVRAVPRVLQPENLANLMTEPSVRNQIEAKAKSTSGVNNISAKELEELQVPICCMEEQAEITRILDERLSAADALEAEIDAGLTRAEALRQSILKQAFSGKLVPQDPEDEPAADLLARIKAEKATKPKAPRKRKAPQKQKEDQNGL